MSYDIYLRTQPCPTCKHHVEPDLPNPTYNLTPIFDRALTGEELPNGDVSEGAVVLLGAATDRPRGLRLLSGRRGGDTVEWLKKAVGNLYDPTQRDAFVALEPSNGWGDLAGAIQVTVRLLDAAETYPDGVWEIR